MLHLSGRGVGIHLFQLRLRNVLGRCGRLFGGDFLSSIISGDHGEILVSQVVRGLAGRRGDEGIRRRTRET